MRVSAHAMFAPNSRFRRPGKLNPAAGIGVAVLLLAVAGGLFFLLQGGAYRGLEPFPATTYRAAPRNLLGNAYRLDAQVDSLLAYEPGIGRLLAVTVEGAPGRVPIFLPEGLLASVHAGQRYRMRVTIREGGLVYVEELEKY